MKKKIYIREILCCACKNFNYMLYPIYYIYIWIQLKTLAGGSPLITWGLQEGVDKKITKYHKVERKSKKYHMYIIFTRILKKSNIFQQFSRSFTIFLGTKNSRDVGRVRWLNFKDYHFLQKSPRTKRMGPKIF